MYMQENEQNIKKISAKIRRLAHQTLEKATKKLKGLVHKEIKKLSAQDLHPLTKMLKLKEGKWIKREASKNPFFWLHKFITSQKKGFFSSVFINEKKKGAGKAIQFIEGHTTQVSPAMRKLLGATKNTLTKSEKKNVSNYIGTKYFPLKSTTTELITEPQEILDRVYEEHTDTLENYFEDIFLKGLRNV